MTASFTTTRRFAAGRHPVNPAKCPKRSIAVWQVRMLLAGLRSAALAVGDEAADPTTVVFDVGLYDADCIWLTENDLTVRGAEAAADWCDKALGAKAAA
jgi:hypothetical protein